MIDWAEGAGRLNAGAQDLEWACFGQPPSGGAPLLVLLHEGLGCVARWRDFPAHLAEATGLGVFAYSRAGYGHSGPCALPRPVDYMTREAVDVLPAVLDATGAERFILFGHSDGATIAAEYVGRIEDFRVRGMVLIAPHFFSEDVGLASIAAAKDRYLNGDLKTRLRKYHRDPDMAFLGFADTWLGPIAQTWDVSEVIDYFRIPALVIQGAADEFGTLQQVREVEARSYAPVDTLILSECGHAPHEERTEDVLRAAADFTNRLVRIEAAGVVPA